MTQPSPHDNVHLIVGMLTAFPELFEQASNAVAEHFGNIRRRSHVWPFDYTDYYTPQMGHNLQRQFFSFERTFDPATLPDVKLWTNRIEKKLAIPRYPVPRPINLDPGYLEPAKLVLASTKDHAHRIYIGRGIYAEITLTYAGKKFQPMPWTYPDYRSRNYLDFFETVRADVLETPRPDPQPNPQETP